MKNYAGFWRRFAAWFIDGLIFWVISAISRNNFPLLVYVLMLAYATWMLGAYGATIGKMVMKIKVTKENGSKLTYSNALVRELSKLLSGIVFGLGYLWMIWDSKKQTWHDKIAKTVVVRS
ncbi:RDD family protein [Candidatus Daviesbacteria bacterium]|nr:RDD family protein [Candidatus Daviesbacteria bacterium]